MIIILKRKKQLTIRSTFNSWQIQEQCLWKVVSAHEEVLRFLMRSDQ